MDPQVAALKRENEMLRERIAQLDEALAGTDPPPVPFGLSLSEGRIFQVLMNRPLATHDAIMAALYRDLNKDEPDKKTIHTFIGFMRKKLKPFGINIESRRDQGWLIPEKSKQIVRYMQARAAA